MKRVLYILILLLMTFTINVNAVEIEKCTDSELKRLNELANNVEFKYNYEFDFVDEDIKEIYLHYDFEILNYDSDLKIYYKIHGSENTEEIFIPDKTLEGDGIYETSKVTFYIYAYTTNLCTNKLLKKVTIELPKYNEYAYFNKDKCQENLDFKYCDEFADVSNLEMEEIDKLLEEYIETGNIDPNDNQNNFLKWYIVGGVLLVGIGIFLVIYIRNKKHKKEEI